MQLRKMSAAEVKNNFGKFLDMAQREPIIVTKHDRAVGIFVSMQDIEDTIWAERAKADAAEGYLSEVETQALMKKYLSFTVDIQDEAA
jgi:antitoxin (DNA-binding transcriptional repressor) of toxin-antitoxin stability system